MKIKQNYKLCWEYIKQIRFYIYFSILIFVAAAVFGFLKPVYFVEIIREFLKHLLEETKDMGAGELIVFILNNNLKSSFFSMLFGLGLGIFPFLSAVFNGYVLGFVMNGAVVVGGGWSLFKLVPHGIFELPAVLVSIALGLKLGMFIFYTEKKKYLIKTFQESLRVFVYVVLPLLILAAIIEGLFIFFS